MPDVLTLKLSGTAGPSPDNGNVAVVTAPPRVRLVRRTDVEAYAGKANRITIRHRHGDAVAVIEIVSPGNKSSRSEFRAFVEKSADLIRQGIHLLVIDLFPPASATLKEWPRPSGTNLRTTSSTCRPTSR
ncbi:MAG: DUF4058 family protein [Gemmataceae bacterium]